MDYVSSIAALNRVVRHLSQSLMVDKRMALKVAVNWSQSQLVNVLIS
jgi:hypothetical protein